MSVVKEPSATGMAARTSVILFLFVIIFTGVRGRSLPSVGVVSIFLMTSWPVTIFPKTGCFDGPGVNQSR